jgi:hypothetical protein
MLLCNSGFWENLTTEELSVTLRDSKEAEELVDNLEDTLLGKQNEVLNNYTIAAIYANKVFKEKTIDYSKIARRAALIVLPLLLMLGIGLMINRQMVLAKIRKEALARVKTEMTRKKSIADHERNGDQFIKGEKYQEAVGEYKEALNIIVNNNLKLPEKQVLLNKKYDTSLLIVDGDNFYTGGEPSKASAKYMEAMNIAAAIAYDKTGLTSRIARIKNVNGMKDLVQQGDNLAVKQKYREAREKYQLAKTMAEQLADDNQKAVIESKLLNLEQRIQEEQERRRQTTLEQRSENNRAAKIYQAKKIEKMGDDRYNQRQYKEALAIYKTARNAYEELSLTQETFSIDEKIRTTEKKTKKILGIFPRR